MKSINIHGSSLSLSQAVYSEIDMVDVDHGHHGDHGDHYNTNAVIILGCKVSYCKEKMRQVNLICRIYQILETGSRVAKGLELSWKSWTNVGVLIAYLQEVICNFLPEIHIQEFCFQYDIVVQNLNFLKQIVPMDPKIFMYFVMINLKLTGHKDEMIVLSGLQKLRGSVVAGNCGEWNF